MHSVLSCLTLQVIISIRRSAQKNDEAGVCPMIRIQNIKLAFDHDPDALKKAVLHRLNIPESDLIRIDIVRKSIDARKKHRISSVYSVDVKVRNIVTVLNATSEDNTIRPTPDLGYRAPAPVHPAGSPPVVVGSGPCGLFAALVLAQAGLCPILVERGKEVGSRVRDVRNFWRNGEFNSESNVLFGEGGAGAFSDGKLTTQIRDGNNRIRKVLEELVRAGAPQEILFQARPHIGTDNLIKVVKNLRTSILSLGGQFRFQTTLTDVSAKNGELCGAVVNHEEMIETSHLVLALGHSARDTFRMLHRNHIPMEAKPFSMGVRIEHPQQMIDEIQYGRLASHPMLGPSDYRLVQHCKNGRAAYTFCMCPGGQVIASSSEPGGIVTNGMSLYARNSPNANSALLVGVDPADYEDVGPLSGVLFQRTWEQKAFQAGGGNYFAPVQLVGDFLLGRASASLGKIIPSYTPGATLGDLSECLPDFVVQTLRLALPAMDKKLKGFAMADAVMTAIESRSSSPVRILRDRSFQSPSMKGLYPGGEGAGYAGGIVSSAVDGIKVAEAVAAQYL